MTMREKNILEEISANLDALVTDSPQGKALWAKFITLHPADIAAFLSDMGWEDLETLFSRLPVALREATFEAFSTPIKVYCLSFMSEHDLVNALHQLPADELTDIFDALPDEDLKRYLKLMNTRAREEVIALMKFDPESAGGIMDTQVITLLDSFTVEQSTKLFQRLSLSREIHQRLFVTDRDHHLLGYINLEDLLLHTPATHIKDFMRENELVVPAEEDQEDSAKKMVHYGLMIAPVIGKESKFLGVISSETLVDVIVEEASENVQKMAAIAPLKYPYFETPLWRLWLVRSYILVILLLAESISGSILRAYEATLGCFLMTFIPMLISTGGNTSSQTSAMVIQGMASGDIRSTNIARFLRRELLMALMLAITLGVATFLRVYYTSSDARMAILLGCAVSSVVLTSVALGSLVPLVLKRFNIDPAFSAGPFLATAMDIIGITIFCGISWLFASKVL